MKPDPSASPATLDVALLRGALEEIPFGVATTRGGRILYANEAFTRIFGLPPGGAEQRLVSSIFDTNTFDLISDRLLEERVFDGRVCTHGFEGHPVDAELHVEWYTSGTLGMGGFLVVRDVSTELGALGRLVDQLGGVLFCIHVSNGKLEFISPAVAKLTGLDATTAREHPVRLTALLSSEDRERLAFMYRRLASGELGEANTQVSVSPQGAARRLLQIRATGRRDTSGVVRHIDGVVIEAAREAEARVGPISARRATVAPPASAPPQPALTGALMELSHELLREGSQHLHALGRELRSLRGLLRVHGTSLPAPVRTELTARIEALSTAAAGAAAMSRGARRGLTGGATLDAPLADLLEATRAVLEPVVGERALTIDLGDAAQVVLSDRVDALSSALIYLGLRAFRFAGSGSLRIKAARAPAPAEPASAPALFPRSPGDHVVLEILASSPPDLAEASIEISLETLQAAVRPAEADRAYQAARAVIAAARGTIESEDADLTAARLVIRFPT